MIQRLIFEQEFENVPEDKLDCFLYMYETAQRNYEAHTATLEGHTDAENATRQSLQTQYVNCLAATASECDIKDLTAEWFYEDHNGTPIQNPIQIVFDTFSGKVQYAVTSAYIRKRKQINSSSVMLTGGSRERIKFLVDKLRKAIDASTLEDRKKDTVRKKLDEILHNVNDRNVTLRNTLLAIATIANIIGFSADGVTLLKDGPEVLNEIMALIAHDKETQDNAIKRLNPPTMLLPAPADDEQSGGDSLQT